MYHRIAENIFKYKVELMGFSILILMIFHSSGITSLFGLKDMLDIGVDIFLLLAGFTCTHSYVKSVNSETPHRYACFYKRRAWRVLPPFLILYIIVYGYKYLLTDRGWLAFLGRITMYDNLFRNCIDMWYVPALLLMYLLIPPYVDLCRKHKFVLCTPLLLYVVLVCMILTGTFYYLPFRMAWARLPIFLAGINIYLFKDKECRIHPFCLLSLNVVCLASAIAVMPYFHPLKYFLFVPVVLCIVYFYDLNSMFKPFFAFAGTFTLENYLIHWLCVGSLHIYVAPAMVAAITAIFPFEILKVHSLGLQATVASLLSYPIALSLAYGYHRLLERFLYCKKI